MVIFLLGDNIVAEYIKWICFSDLVPTIILKEKQKTDCICTSLELGVFLL